MILGITGTNGSGKGAVVDYLVSKGFTHYSVRTFLTEMLHTHGRTIDRSEMRLLANELRATKDPAFIIRTLHEQAISDKSENAVIESVRNVGEAQFLLSVDAFLLAVDAEQQLRFTRVQGRRSATDQVDFATFVEHEEREMRPEGPHDMDIRGVMRLAHQTIENNSTLNELYTRVDEALSL